MNMHQMPEHIMTMAEVKEYKKLHAELMGNYPFVVLDYSDPKTIRFNILASKYLKFRVYVNQLS